MSSCRLYKTPLTRGKAVKMTERLNIALFSLISSAIISILHDNVERSAWNRNGLGTP